MSDDQVVANPPPKYNSLESLESYLSVIKSLKKEDLDEEYFQLMSSAKQVLGDIDFRMAPFYFQYGNYVLERIERNGEVFGTFKPTKQQRQEKIAEVNESDEESKEEENAHEGEQTQLKHQPANSNVVYQDADVTIENEGNQQRTVEEHTLTPPGKSAEVLDKEDAALPQTAEKEEDEDEEEICYENLEVCLTILMKQQSKYLSGEIQLSDQEMEHMLQLIAKAKGRMGDFYTIKENFVQALVEYDEAIQYRKKLHKNEPDRYIAALEMAVGNAYLFEGKEGCEDNAIIHLSAAVDVLVDTLELRSLSDGYPRPTLAKPTVERIKYLPKWDDSEDIKDLKQLISELLDKIEDASIQVKEFTELAKVRKEQKQQAEEQALHDNGFAPTPKDVKVVSLGTFGNANPLIRRKAPTPAVIPVEPSKPAEPSEPSTTEHQSLRPIDNSGQKS